MKDFYLKSRLLTLFILLNLFSLAQRSNGIAVEGKVNAEEGSVEGAIIQMYQDGRRLDNYGVGSDGRYKVELPYNHKFELIFERLNNFSQKIVIDANVPRVILQSDPKFPPFPLEVNLFTEIPGIDKSFSEKTVLKIYYSPNVDNFISELYYNDAQIKKLIDQAIAQSKLIGKEADYLSRLTKAELAELRREYNQLLEQAGNEYSNEQFLAALDGFKAASKIFPNEQFPKDRIAEINDLLGLMMVAADLDKALLERFNTLIQEADLLFNEEKYSDAKNSYNRALSIKPTDTHALQQVSAINDLLKQQQIDRDYFEIIAQADNSFKELLYTEAIKRYQKAIDVKNNEEYPKNKINEINEILAKEAKNLESQASYKQAIFQAETMFEKQFYEKSIASYRNALTFKPNDPAASGKIAEIQAIMEELAARLQYDKYIKSADKLYKKKMYAEALKDYQEANTYLPDEQHASNRINEIDGIIDTQKNFADIVFEADNQFNTSNYEVSKKLYAEALKIRTDDKHSLGRLVEIDNVLATKSLNDRYENILVDANSLFEASDFEKAREKFNEAISLKPKEKYPKDKIGEINSALQQIAKSNQNYQEAIEKADGLFQQEDYDKAKVAFNDAASIKPEDNYPSQMVAKIDDLQAEQAELLAKQQEAERIRLEQEAASEAARLAAIQAEKDKNYTDAISRADNLFDQNDYENSRNEYRSALFTKPDETYPQQRIDEIGNLLSQLSAIQKAYEDAVAKGDREFRREGFEEAKTAYALAKEAKADETYPGIMISRIDSIVETRVRIAAEEVAAEAARLAAIQAEKDKNYADAISRADNLFDINDYENSRNEYRSALTIKPEETYPQQRIDEIGNLLSQLSAAQKAYEDAVTKGDREFRREGFEEAKTAYALAKGAKADETYPGIMISRIDSIVETRARIAAEEVAAEAARLASIQAEKDKNYAEAISRADNLFNQNEYENSRNEYRSALTIKPEETYPQQRIVEIGNLLSQLSAAQKAYEDAVANGDREFRREGFEEAKTSYALAKQAKTDETYPGMMISRIDSIVETRARIAAEEAATEAARIAAIQAEKDKNYADAISRADNLFNQNDYENSRNEYRSALTIKPEENYPQQRIDEIGNLLSQLSAAQKAYEDAVANGDREFRREGFDLAKLAYGVAKQAKEDESYPDVMIARIDSIVETRARIAQEAAEAEAARLAANQAEKDKNYADAISRADNLFNQNDYENSRNEYHVALTIKPEETYPQQRIDEIGNLLREMELARQEKELLDKNYANLIEIADRFFNEPNYDQAKDNYLKAINLKSEEEYPKQKLLEIEQLLEQLKLDERYRTIVLAADGFFRTEVYTDAKKEYESALVIKPEEQYPKNQIRKIEEIFEKEQNALLAEQRTKEDIERRKSEIDLMNSELDEQAILNEAGLASLYNEFIIKADAFFNDKQYNVSRAWYFKANDIKPEETYPTERITVINQIIDGMLLSQRDRDYQKYVNLADSTFRVNQLAVARGWFNRALSEKSDEIYPKNQLAEIEKRVNEQIAGQSGQLFENHMQNATNAFDSGNYNVARFWNKKALELRPNDSDAKAKLKEIESNL